MSARRIEAVTASVLFAVAAVTLPAAATGAAHADGAGDRSAARVAANPATTSTSRAATTTTRTTSGTPCPTFSLPQRLYPGSVARSYTFDYGGVYDWAVAGDGTTSPTADAAAARTGAYGMLLPDLSAGAATSSVSSLNGAGTFKVSAFVRLAPGSADAVVQLRVLDRASGKVLAKVRKKVGDDAFVKLSRQYSPGWTNHFYDCNGSHIGVWDEATPVTLELSVVGKDVVAPVAVEVDDATVTFVRSGDGPATTTCRTRNYTGTSSTSHRPTRS